MSSPDSTRRFVQVCRFFNTPGGCRRGPDCTFLHTEDGSSPRSTFNSPSRGFQRGGAPRPAMPRAPNGLCDFYYNRGFCSRGSDCRFRHESPDQGTKAPPSPTNPMANLSNLLTPAALARKPALLCHNDLTTSRRTGATRLKRLRSTPRFRSTFCICPGRFWIDTAFDKHAHCCILELVVAGARCPARSRRTRRTPSLPRARSLYHNLPITITRTTNHDNDCDCPTDPQSQSQSQSQPSLNSPPALEFGQLSLGGGQSNGSSNHHYHSYTSLSNIEVRPGLMYPSPIGLSVFPLNLLTCLTLKYMELILLDAKI